MAGLLPSGGGMKIKDLIEQITKTLTFKLLMNQHYEHSEGDTEKRGLSSPNHQYFLRRITHK